MRSDVPIPPRELRFMGEDDEAFITTGDRLACRLDELCPLRGTRTILDVGSGYGRVAHALLRRADFTGRYIGFDILSRHVGWCTTHLTPQSAGRFEFIHLDVHNERYNPRGQWSPDEISFPIADGSVDLAILTSVFTHLYPSTIRRYLRELGRTLAPAGRAYVTAFVLDPSLFDGTGRRQAAELMPYTLDEHCRYFDPDDPLYRIGYEQAWLGRSAGEAGLSLEIAELGTWRRNVEAKGTQDALVLAPAAPQA